MRNDHEAKLNPEPSIDEDHVVVTVRHPSLGTKIRLFNSACKMIQVYHWVGSLENEPEFYELQDFSRVTIYPSDDVSSGVFKIIETDRPISMSQEGEVGFFGFGVNDDVPIVSAKTALSKGNNFEVFSLSVISLEKCVLNIASGYSAWSYDKSTLLQNDAQ